MLKLKWGKMKNVGLIGGHDVCMNVWLCMSPTSTFEPLTDFHEICYGHYVIRNHSNISGLLSNFVKSAKTMRQTHKLTGRERHLM
jgi:hypothetical protein